MSEPDQLELVVAALDSGRAARELLGIAAPPVQAKWYDPVLTMFGAGRDRPSFGLYPTRDTVRRAANALDRFGADLVAVAGRLDDPDLDVLADASRTWGSDLWEDRVAAGELHRPVADAMHRLAEHERDARRRAS